MDMIRYLLLLAIIICAALPANSLSEGEIDALRGILETWPILSSLEPAWNGSRLEDACDGWFAILCSDTVDPHVIAL
jgi:hypothetical protein